MKGGGGVALSAAAANILSLGGGIFFFFFPPFGEPRQGFSHVAEPEPKKRSNPFPPLRWVNRWSDWSAGPPSAAARLQSAAALVDAADVKIQLVRSAA